MIPGQSTEPKIFIFAIHIVIEHELYRRITMERHAAGYNAGN